MAKDMANEMGMIHAVLDAEAFASAVESLVAAKASNKSAKKEMAIAELNTELPLIDSAIAQIALHRNSTQMATLANAKVISQQSRAVIRAIVTNLAFAKLEGDKNFSIVFNDKDAMKADDFPENRAQIDNVAWRELETALSVAPHDPRSDGFKKTFPMPKKSADAKLDSAIKSLEKLMRENNWTTAQIVARLSHGNV